MSGGSLNTRLWGKPHNTVTNHERMTWALDTAEVPSRKQIPMSYICVLLRAWPSFTAVAFHISSECPWWLLLSKLCVHTCSLKSANGLYDVASGRAKVAGDIPK